MYNFTKGFCKICKFLRFGKILILQELATYKCIKYKERLQ